MLAIGQAGCLRGTRRAMNDRGAVWFVIGVGGAVALGVVLTGFRGMATASTLAFVFLALTIVVAEIGGRGPGLATAVVSALSLNFFLTEPYLSLEIDKPGDVAAFVALMACGLIAAAFGKRRARAAEQALEARGDLELLARTATGLSSRAPIEQVLEDVRRFFNLGGVVLRRADERLIAAAPASQASLPAPPTELDPATLVGSDTLVHRLGRAGFRLPDRGGRLRLPGREPLFLDLWEGSPEGINLDQRRALTVAAMMIALSDPTSGS
jgi:two-component system sensor histidine kinase KdpD